MNKKLVIFNLKMNAPVLADWRKIGKSKADVVVCPPFVYLTAFKTKTLKNFKLGAQDCFWEGRGAYTGEISPEMLKNLGAEYVIIGHSERRKYLGETDEMINKKIIAALKTGLKVVFCVGENSVIRKRDIKAVKNFIKGQLKKDLEEISKLRTQSSNLIIAYEPVWAIGTGKACKPEDALEMVKFIKQILKTQNSKLKTRILYGGSVDGENVADFIKYKDIDGVLVGGVSLKPKEVLKIIKKVG